MTTKGRKSEVSVLGGVLKSTSSSKTLWNQVKSHQWSKRGMIQWSKKNKKNFSLYSQTSSFHPCYMGRMFRRAITLSSMLNWFFWFSMTLLSCWATTWQPVEQFFEEKARHQAMTETNEEAGDQWDEDSLPPLPSLVGFASGIIVKPLIRIVFWMWYSVNI